MNPFGLLWKREHAVFHVRMGGCRGCSEMVDILLRDRQSGANSVMECTSPMHADLVMVTGFWADGLAENALRVIEQAPSSRRVIVVGDCALSRGLVSGLIKKKESLSKYMIPDEEISGCPVTLESLAGGIRRVAG